jgi:hypothetical protein
MLRGGFGRLNEKPYTNSIPTLFLEKVKGSNRLSNCISIYSSCRLVRGEQRNISPPKDAAGHAPTKLGKPAEFLKTILFSSYRILPYYFINYLLKK